MSKQTIGTFVKAGVLGVIFATLAGIGIVSMARAAMLLLGATATLSGSQMKTHDIATELDRAFAAATATR